MERLPAEDSMRGVPMGTASAGILVSRACVCGRDPAGAVLSGTGDLRKNDG